MQSLDASPVATLQLPARSVALSREELDATVGGVDPLGLAVLAFLTSVVVGVLDRIFFGGCRCR